MKSDRKAMIATLKDTARWGFLCLLFVVAGCGAVKSATDWIVGTDKPEAEVVDENNDGVPDTAPIAKLTQILGDKGPAGAGGAILTYIAMKLAAMRRRQQAKEVT